MSMFILQAIRGASGALFTLSAGGAITISVDNQPNATIDVVIQAAVEA